MQLQRALLADDGKRVREVLLHVLLHLRSTNGRANSFQPPLRPSEGEKKKGRLWPGIAGRGAHLHAGDVDPLPDAELLSHQPQLGHAVQHHVVELDPRQREQ